MKKNNKKILISIYIFTIVLLSVISIIITINANDNENSYVDKEKIYYEIKYLDSQIIYMSNALNNLNNNNYFSNANINWEEQQDSLEILYNYWNSVILDLNNLSIDKSYLTDFGKNLDNLSVSIKNKDKQGSFDNLIALYSKLSIYIDVLNYNESITNLFYAKYNLLYAYLIAEKGNWTLTHENILKSDEYLSAVLNSLEENKLNQYNINQAYISIKELENLINIKDLDVFYLKYKIAIQKLQNI